MNAQRLFFARTLVRVLEPPVKDDVNQMRMLQAAIAKAGALDANKIAASLARRRKSLLVYMRPESNNARPRSLANLQLFNKRGQIDRCHRQVNDQHAGIFGATQLDCPRLASRATHRLPGPGASAFNARQDS